MTKFKIPQKVDIEDKIFGNILTLRQLIIIGVGGGISYIIYAILQRTYELNLFEIGLIAIPAMVAVAFAFVKIGPISLFKYSILFIEFIVRPHRRVWTKEGGQVFALIKDIPKKIAVTKKEGEKADRALRKEDLEKLSEKDKSKKLGELSTTLDFEKHFNLNDTS